MPEVVHIASQAVQVGSRIRQRCVWCGHELIDVDLSTISVMVGAESDVYPTWPGGGLVATDGGATYVVEHKDGDQLPPTSCVAPVDARELDTTGGS